MVKRGSGIFLSMSAEFGFVGFGLETKAYPTIRLGILMISFYPGSLREKFVRQKAALSEAWRELQHK